MTHLDLYNAALIEQNKLEAPTLLIEDYNYLLNKAIVQYINLTYARFDLNQQASDDLRWLQKSAELEVTQRSKIIPPLEEANYACVLPDDYLHILNCVAHFTPKSEIEDKCKTIKDDDTGVYYMCRRLTANQIPAIMKNAYFKPTYKNPYFYINESTSGGKVSYEIESATSEECGYSGWRQELEEILNPVPETHNQYMEIRCGKNKLFYPDTVYVDYLRKPEPIELTWEQVNGIEDTSPQCEFPNAVAYEIINIFSRLLLENASDERLRTHVAINQTIAGGQQVESK